MRRSRFIALVMLALACAPSEPPDRWQAIAIPTDADFRGLWFTDSLTGWVAGGGFAIPGGIVGATRDGGRTWAFESGIVAGGAEGYGLGRLQFWDARHGLLASESGVLMTEDAGETWRRARDADAGGVFDLQFADDRHGWAVGSVRLAATDDGGDSWRTLARNTAATGYLSGTAVHFVDRQRGWMASHHGELRRSLDGGKSWEIVALPHRPGERPALWDVTFAGTEHGWVVGERGVIFHTNDGGLTWTLQETGVPIVRVIPKGEPPRPREPIPELEMEPERLALTAVDFLDVQHGVAVGFYSDVAESVVLRTRDGGARWEVEHVQPGELLRAVFLLDDDHAWAVGDRARAGTQVVLRYAGS